jgi:hypothetical protein
MKESLVDLLLYMGCIGGGWQGDPLNTRYDPILVINIPIRIHSFNGIKTVFNRK